jgi:hypothetical protein
MSERLRPSAGARDSNPTAMPRFLGPAPHGHSGMRRDRPSRATWAEAMSALLREADVLGRPSTVSVRATAWTLGVSEPAVDDRFAEVVRYTVTRDAPYLRESEQVAITSCADIAAAIAVLRTRGLRAHGASLDHAIRHAPGRLLVSLVRRSDACHERDGRGTRA